MIDVASHCPDSTLQATVQTVTWDGADWQLVLQPNGDDGTAPRELTDLTGFVPMFPGVDYTPLAG